MESPDGPDERRCHSCGEWLEHADRYCPSCGTQVDETATTEPDVDTAETDGAEPHQTNQIENGGWEHGDEWGADSQPVSPDTDERQPDDTAGRHGSMVGKESKFRTAGVAVGLGILGPVFLIIGTIIAALALSGVDISQGAFIVVGTSISQILGFGGVALAYLRYRGFEWGQIRSYLGVRVPSLRDLGVVVLGYIGIIATLIGISIIATLFLPEPAQNEGAQQAIENPDIIPAMIVMMLLVVGPFEELLFRGVIQNRLRENFDTVKAIVIASAIFASIHVIALAGDPIGMLVTITILFFPATIFGIVYEYTGNLVVPALLHGIHNSVLLSFILLGPEIQEQATILVETGRTLAGL